MSSPMLNNIILCGCMLAYITIILMGINSSLFPKKAFVEVIMNIVCAVRLKRKSKRREREETLRCLDSSLVFMYQFYISIWFDVQQNMACTFDIYEFTFNKKSEIEFLFLFRNWTFC